MVKRLLANTFFLHLPRKAQAIPAVPTSDGCLPWAHSNGKPDGMVLLAPGTASDTSPWLCPQAQVLL